MGRDRVLGLGTTWIWLAASLKDVGAAGLVKSFVESPTKSGFVRNGTDAFLCRRTGVIFGPRNGAPEVLPVTYDMCTRR